MVVAVCDKLWQEWMIIIVRTVIVLALYPLLPCPRICRACWACRASLKIGKNVQQYRYIFIKYIYRSVELAIILSTNIVFHWWRRILLYHSGISINRHRCVWHVLYFQCSSISRNTLPEYLEHSLSSITLTATFPSPLLLEEYQFMDLTVGGMSCVPNSIVPLGIYCGTFQCLFLFL